MAVDLSQVQQIKPEMGSGVGDSAGGGGFEVSSSADAQQFSQSMSAARERFSDANQAGSGPVKGIGESKSIGNQLMSGLSDMSVRLKSDHKQISTMLQKATVGGDDAMMMKALLALGDYQQRVQIVSKVVSKAASSLDQLTRLQ
jgi:Type III secretion basal body protein I, YscI, HrpB, PscI